MNIIHNLNIYQTSITYFPYKNDSLFTADLKARQNPAFQVLFDILQ